MKEKHLNPRAYFTKMISPPQERYRHSWNNCDTSLIRLK